jgi:hypothetical protein
MTGKEPRLIALSKQNAADETPFDDQRSRGGVGPAERVNKNETQFAMV